MSGAGAGGGRGLLTKKANTSTAELVPPGCGTPPVNLRAAACGRPDALHPGVRGTTVPQPL